MARARAKAERGRRPPGKRWPTVLLVQARGVLRDALHCLLDCRGAFRVVAAVDDGREAAQLMRRSAPDVVLVDVAVSGPNGVDATRAIARVAPGVPVLILGTHVSPAMREQASAAGARGLISRDSDGDELLAALRTVAAGGKYLPTLPRPPHRAPGSDLTPTEREILRLVSSGNANAEVARILGLSPRTVETYRLRLMRKLGLEDLPALVRYAILHGIAPL